MRRIQESEDVEEREFLSDVLIKESMKDNIEDFNLKKLISESSQMFLVPEF